MKGVLRLAFVPSIIAGTVLLVAWQMLLPGYLLTLDMVWAPNMPLAWSNEQFNNAAPIWALVALLAHILPSWVVQKILLLSLLTLLLGIPYRYIPYVENCFAKFFVGLLYLLNPFVYARILAGQWLFLIGYALLPLVLHSLEELLRLPSKKSALRLGISLSLLSIFSVHILYLMLFVIGIRLLAHLIRTGKGSVRAWLYAGLALLGVVLVCTYWLVPGLLRHTPLEGRFTETHYETFAAAANGIVPLPLNVLMLGGFWGEGTIWKYYFLWPQELSLFWIVAVLVGLICASGALYGLKKPALREYTVFLISIGVFAYITALGAAETPFQSLNLWFYHHVPFWSGLRDSQKISSLLAMVYCALAGLGVEALINKLTKKNYLADMLVPLIFIVPILCGIYEWGGFHKQLTPSFYPEEWQEAKAILAQAPRDEKVLVLPWHGYFSLDFANELIVANPAVLFFGRDKVLASKSVEAGAVYDQEINIPYQAIDHLFATTIPPDPQYLRKILRDNHIVYVLFIKNALASTSNEWSDALMMSTSSKKLIETYFGKNILISGEILLLQGDF